MTNDQMLEWTNTIGVLACSWPVVVLFLLVAFRQPLRRLIDELSSMPGSFSLKFGSAELKREIAQMVTSMQQLHAEVQNEMSAMVAMKQRMEQMLVADERAHGQVSRLSQLMAGFYLFEIESLLWESELDLLPAERQKLVALRDSLHKLRTELAADTVEGEATRQPIAGARTAVGSNLTQSAATRDGLLTKKESPDGEVLVLLIRHGAKGSPLADDRVEQAIERVRRACEQGVDHEDQWPFPRDWTWASNDCDQRARAVSGFLTPLSREGEEQTQQLALWLRPLLAPFDLSKTVFLSSCYRHAQDMANSLSRQCAAGEQQARVLLLRSLTPNSKTETLEDILTEAEQKGLELRQQRLVVCVGHEARLSNLFTRLTGQRTRPFDRADAVAVSAAAWVDLQAGTGRQKFRLPVADHQEEALRSKVQSKMTVATLLAGFVAAVLFNLLMAGMTSRLEQVAGILITVSLALFVAVVYMYDRLSMPEGFWVVEDRPGRSSWRPGNKNFQRDQDQQGQLYAHMVWTWAYVFTPAVLFALLGFLVLVAELANFWLLIGIAAALFAVGLFYTATRPRLGTD